MSLNFKVAKLALNRLLKDATCASRVLSQTPVTGNNLYSDRFFSLNRPLDAMALGRVRTDRLFRGVDQKPVEQSLLGGDQRLRLRELLDGHSG